MHGRSLRFGWMSGTSGTVLNCDTGCALNAASHLQMCELPIPTFIEISGHHRADAIPRVQLKQQASIQLRIHKVCPFHSCGGGWEGGRGSSAYSVG